jgi:hypothetical protein
MPAGAASCRNPLEADRAVETVGRQLGRARELQNPRVDPSALLHDVGQKFPTDASFPAVGSDRDLVYGSSGVASLVVSNEAHDPASGRGHYQLTALDAIDVRLARVEA